MVRSGRSFQQSLDPIRWQRPTPLQRQPLYANRFRADTARPSGGHLPRRYHPQRTRFPRQVPGETPPPLPGYRKSSRRVQRFDTRFNPFRFVVAIPIPSPSLLPSLPSNRLYNNPPIIFRCPLSGTLLRVLGRNRTNRGRGGSGIAPSQIRASRKGKGGH